MSYTGEEHDVRVEVRQFGEEPVPSGVGNHECPLTTQMVWSGKDLGEHGGRCSDDNKGPLGKAGVVGIDRQPTEGHPAQTRRGSHN
jgi:hypothetical protein